MKFKKLIIATAAIAALVLACAFLYLIFWEDGPHKQKGQQAVREKVKANRFDPIEIVEGLESPQRGEQPEPVTVMAPQESDLFAGDLYTTHFMEEPYEQPDSIPSYHYEDFRLLRNLETSNASSGVNQEVIQAMMSKRRQRLGGQND